MFKISCDIYICICIYVYITCIHEHTHIYIHVYKYAYTHIYIYHTYITHTIHACGHTNTYIVLNYYVLNYISPITSFIKLFEYYYGR